MSKFSDAAADLMAGSGKLVTQYMHAWDGVMTEAAILKVAHQEVKDNSSLTTRKDGSGRIRPSNIGHQCQRLQALSFLGFPALEPDDTSLMDDGTQRHYYWQKAGLSAGFLSDIEVQVSLPSLKIKGQTDGRMVDGSVFELKTTGPALYERIVNKERKPTDPHLLQVHAYMAAEGVREASIVYELRSYQVQWHEFRIQWDQDVYDDLVAQTKGVLNRVGRGEMPPMIEPCADLDGTTFNRCKYHLVCPSAVVR